MHFAPAPQALPHAPQLVPSLWRSAQTPLLQSTRPMAQAQAPLTHEAPGPQAVVQLPQCAVSAERSAQVSPQSVLGAAQVLPAPPLPLLIPPVPLLLLDCELDMDSLLPQLTHDKRPTRMPTTAAHCRNRF